MTKVWIMTTDFTGEIPQCCDLLPCTTQLFESMCICATWPLITYWGWGGGMKFAGTLSVLPFYHHLPYRFRHEKERRDGCVVFLNLIWQMCTLRVGILNRVAKKSSPSVTPAGGIGSQIKLTLLALHWWNIKQGWQLIPTQEHGCALQVQSQCQK